MTTWREPWLDKLESISLGEDGLTPYKYGKQRKVLNGGDIGYE